jgi:hypothetical protein
VEFVVPSEVASSLRSRGLVLPSDAETGLAGFDHAKPSVEVRIGKGARGELAIDAPSGRVAQVLEIVLHKLRLAPIYLVPAAPWRNAFDLLREPLAEHERWMTIDAEAIVEQNTRDPLLVEPGDLHLLRDMIEALLAAPEADDALHGIAIVAPGPPVVAQVLPRSGVRLLVPTPDIARQACDAANHFLLGRPT